jgi:broad specificity phosphatase PhoE
MATRLLLVRHGQTEWNREERFRGRADVPLNDTGLAQAAAVGRRVAAEWKPVAVYASPLSRAMQTGAAIAEPFGLAVEPLPGLIDIDYGQWQGLSPDEVKARWPELLDDWYHKPHRAYIPGGEMLADLDVRGMAAVRQLAAQHAGQAIALVGHTVINRVILLGVLGLGLHRFWHIRQDTAAINIIEAEGDDFVLGSLNDTAHLSDLSQASAPS